jgi:hypothetical protein
MKPRPTAGKTFLVSTVAGIAICIASFFFLVTGTLGMGMTLFLIAPFAAGFVIAFITRGRNRAATAAISAVTGSLGILIAVGKEGPLCALMALPFLLFGVGIGVLAGDFARKWFVASWDASSKTGMILVMLPTLVLSGHKLEQSKLNTARTETISTSIRVNGSPEDTWLLIQSIDSLQGGKPWLMHVGLPVPLRCTLEKTAVGARRTCYFNVGYIEETVTEWNPPHSMKLRIDRTHMAGRHWLGFENAAYYLEAQGNTTLLTRTTTISSHLYPVWYWEPVERLGVESEHKYLLQNVERRAGELR